jgi:hypothetical protein
LALLLRGINGLTMTDNEYLKSKGWRLVSKKKTKYGLILFWDHDNHQPLRHGFFTQTGAVDHQKHLDKGDTCKCIPRTFQK